ncbi:VCBS domain-containing protein [Pseudogulbenkiania ferrooxidans]|uniref:Uncharacterized protein n=1 Tax=Pseudogulbenkiania ferrooxidans 2002 TaxID=279714 RepID=B9Z0F2_9NEIS|nr:VCBS domain-containing protein [Pseudogulbenkiania ferrooxidans]EEG09558.1 hypothetical protein FuraDRAFT_0574 [Pseudogulbenkiania ferrooxidans 2002]
MKKISFAAALPCTALIALAFAGSAYAGNDNYYVDNLGGATVKTAATAPQASFGTRTAVIDADTHLRLTVAQDGSVQPGSVGVPRDDSMAFHVANTSAQPVNVVIEGEGAAPVTIGQVGAHKEANFAWRFDNFKAVPRDIKVGQSAVKLYVLNPRSTN